MKRSAIRKDPHVADYSLGRCAFARMADCLRRLGGTTAIQAVLRRSRLTFGAGRLSNSWLLRALAPLGRDVLAKTSYGCEIFVDPSDSIGRTIFYFGDHDRKVSAILMKVLRPGDVCVDVGSNIGSVSLLAASLVGSTGLVLSFEPQPNLVELSRRTFDANGFHWVKVHAVALSDEDGEAQLNIPGTSAGYASFRYHGGSGEHIQVTTAKGDTALSAALAGRKIRLMKLDVEGHEAAVVKGCSNYLRGSPPDFILFEFLFWQGEFWKDELVLLLSSLGYDFFGIPHRSLTGKLQRIDAGSEPHSQIRDAVAVRRGPGEEDLTAALLS